LTENKSDLISFTPTNQFIDSIPRYCIMIFSAEEVLNDCIAFAYTHSQF